MSWFGAAGRHFYFLLALGVLAPLYLAFTWSDQLGILSGDAPAYMVMAQHYSAHPAAASSVADLSSAYSRFPPLYPIVLARLYAAYNLVRAHALSTALLLGGFAALYGLLCAAGLPFAEAALLTLLLGMLRASWLMALSLQSEVLYLPLSCLALLGMTLYQRQRRPEPLYLAALAIAAAILARSIGVMLLPPLALMLLRAPRRPPLLALAIALAPPLLWSLLHRTGMGYGDTLRGYYHNDLLHSLPAQIATVLGSLRWAFEVGLAQGQVLRHWIDAYGLLAVAAALVRAAALKPDALYLLLYLATVAVWPYAQVESPRYLAPVLGLLIAQPVLLLAQAQARAWPGVRYRRAAVAGLGVLLLCGSLPAIALAAQRYRDADTSGIPAARSIRYWYEIEDPALAFRTTAAEALYISLLKDLDQEVPKDRCVIAIRPDLIHFYAGRWSGIPPDEDTSDAEFDRELRQQHCRYLFMTSQQYAEYPTPLYPLQRLNGKIVIVDYRALPPTRPGESQVVAILARLKD